MKKLILVLFIIIMGCTPEIGLRNGYIIKNNGDKTFIKDNSVRFHNNGVLIQKRVIVDGDGILIDQDNINYSDIKEITLIR